MVWFKVRCYSNAVIAIVTVFGPTDGDNEHALPYEHLHGDETTPTWEDMKRIVVTEGHRPPLPKITSEQVYTHLTHMYTHTHTYTHKHTRTHTHIHTHTYTHTQTVPGLMLTCIQECWSVSIPDRPSSQQLKQKLQQQLVQPTTRICVDSKTGDQMVRLDKNGQPICQQ